MSEAIRCYDNGGKTADRYTVVFMNCPESAPRMFLAVAMSGEPFHPQGIGMTCSAQPGRHLGRRVALESLPRDCRALVHMYTYHEGTK
jgi:hypothetical protein